MIADTPGVNTALNPDAAPPWMHTLVERLAAPQRRGVDKREGKQAAVLMLMSGSATETLPADAEILLMHRSPHMRSHSGQIAFPGGRLDPGDLNPVDAALREAWEETGLDRRSVTPLAQLAEVHVRVSGYPVHPILGHWHTPMQVGVVSPDEADEVFTVPLSQLINPENRISVGWNDWQGPAFRIDDYIIWGFTGGLLSAAIHYAGWEEAWDQHTVHNLQETLARSRNNERLRNITNHPRREE